MTIIFKYTAVSDITYGYNDNELLTIVILFMNNHFKFIFLKKQKGRIINT